MKKLLNQKQASRLLNLSPRTLERFRADGRGPLFVRLGALIRYDLDDLMTWVDRNRWSSASKPADVRRSQRTSRLALRRRRRR